MLPVKPILSLCLLAVVLSRGLPAAAEVGVADEPVSTADATRVVAYIRNARWERILCRRPRCAAAPLTLTCNRTSLS